MSPENLIFEQFSRTFIWDFSFYDAFLTKIYKKKWIIFTVENEI